MFSKEQLQARIQELQAAQTKFLASYNVATGQMAEVQMQLQYIIDSEKKNDGDNKEAPAQTLKLADAQPAEAQESTQH